MDNKIESLMVEVIHFLSEEFPNQAILKGGMVLRLLDCPRYTNDIDYVFIPYDSKKDVNSLIVNALKKIPDIECTSQINSTCIRYIISKNETRIQLEVNVAPECKSDVMSTSSLARSNGFLPRIIKVMDYSCALAHKIAAWNERGLIRDLYDIAFFSNVLRVYPDMNVLSIRLKSVSFRHKSSMKKKEMTVRELIEKLTSASISLTLSAIELELHDYLAPSEIIGLDKRIKSGINRVVEFCKSSDM